jgi:hypothetical protein
VTAEERTYATAINELKREMEMMNPWGAVGVKEEFDEKEFEVELENIPLSRFNNLEWIISRVHLFYFCAVVFRGLEFGQWHRSDYGEVRIRVMVPSR